MPSDFAAGKRRAAGDVARTAGLHEPMLYAVQSQARGSSGFLPDVAAPSILTYVAHRYVVE